MALKTFKPTTPGQRQLVLVDRSELHKGGPVKTLTEGLRSKGGRNNYGRITVRWRGGGHKRTYRIMDFRRRKFDMTATVERARRALDYVPAGRIVLAEDGQILVDKSRHFQRELGQWTDSEAFLKA